jgi:hypothetical protein
MILAMVGLALFEACDQESAGDTADRTDTASAEAQPEVEKIDPRTIPPDGVPAVPAGFDVDSALAALDAAAPDEFPLIRYTRLHVSTRSIRDSIRKAFARKEETMAAYRVLTTLNRQELGYIGVGDTIVVPDTIIEDLRAYSVFPLEYPEGANIPKLLFVSNAQQAYACYEYGHLVRFAAANTGRESKPTLPGRYALNWKERMRTSSLNEHWKLPYNWNFHLYAGNAFHQFTMPGRPVSHSCVRQFREDAEWLFDWGQVGLRNESGRVKQLTGTPVIIIDMFDFSRKKGGPWLELTSNRDGILELPEDPMEVEEALIPISQVPHGARGGLPDRERYETAEEVLRARGVIREEARLSPSINYNKLREQREARRTAQRASTTEESNETAESSSTTTESSTAPSSTPAETSTPEVKNVPASPPPAAPTPPPPAAPPPAAADGE